MHLLKKQFESHDMAEDSLEDDSENEDEEDAVNKWLSKSQVHLNTVDSAGRFENPVATIRAKKQCGSEIFGNIRVNGPDPKLDSTDDEMDQEAKRNAKGLGFNQEQISFMENLLRKNRRGKNSELETAPRNVEVTKDQLVARQAGSKQLPTFRGEPELWPIFISSYENTTRACGFSNLDNLKRLQDSLKGDALEAVRSRLVLPETVPDVINDLRSLFGKPERLLRTLMNKVRKAQPPRLDRMETFIHFGITVKQVCDHLEAAGLGDHLQNPMLVKELAEKLPDNYKIEWVRYKRTSQGSPLRVFSNFMSSIVEDVSEAAELTPMDGGEHSRGSKGRRKEFAHVHNADFPLPPKEDQKISKSCLVCKRTDHKLRFCDDFKGLSVTDRIKMAEKLKLCKLCLNSHGKSRCNFKVRCNIGGCQGGHHPLLHLNEQFANNLQIECNTHNGQNRAVIFRMVPITLYVDDLAYDTLAFLDEGSSATLLKSSVADELQASGEIEPLVVTWTGNMKRYEDRSRKVNLFISPRDSDQKLPLNNVRTVTELQLPQQKVKFGEVCKQYTHLQDLPVMDHSLEEPRIMIGLDNLHVFAPIESRIGKPGQPVGVKSLLGWTVYGPCRKGPCPQVALNFHGVDELSNQQLHDMLRNQYLLEEVRNPSCVPESDEDQRALAILKSSTVFTGDRYQTGLLWRNDSRGFPDSYGMAYKRALALERKLSKDPDLQAKVNLEIQQYLEKGYAHPATTEELNNTQTSGKIRLVWDAAASVGGISLNSQLLCGPDLLVPLQGVICRFREKPVAFGGDIMEMYHQLKIRPEDRQAQRFLFRQDLS
ncbi:uncharacterized protein LOC129752597 [Uranotaenia lowii]|uniref:uncharacterized protein LOC129752597 n=1 Tax=Uranotaenia lowii TaxID=190385 RepID=UPI002479108A|nr:uncharacterized protein LOC129752597 [Uranotaenia lowii]